MRPIQRMVAGAVAGALALSLSLPGVASAAPPSNDAYADATGVASFPFDEQVEMWEATSETGETATCDNSYNMDRSVWYRVTAPESTMRIWIAGEYGSTTAAIYGPFQTAPADVTLLGDPLWCVNGTGDYEGVVEPFSAGIYFVQLTVTPWGQMYPVIHIDSAQLQSPELSIGSASVKAKGVAADVTLAFVCWPYFGETELESEYGYVRITQSVGGRQLARGQAEIDGLYLCDGSTLNTITATVLTDTVPFKKGIAYVEAYVWLQYYGGTLITLEMRLR